MNEELSDVQKQIAEKDADVWEKFQYLVGKLESLVQEFSDFWVEYKRVRLATKLGSTRFSWWLARNIHRSMLPVPRLLPIKRAKKKKLKVIDFLPEKGTYCMKCGNQFEHFAGQMTYEPEREMLRCRCPKCQYQWLSHTVDELNEKD